MKAYDKKLFQSIESQVLPLLQTAKLFAEAKFTKLEKE